MKLEQIHIIVSALFVGLSAAGQLSNRYLPPNYAGQSDGGHSNFLQGPKRPSNQYLAPHGGGGGGGGGGGFAASSNLHYHGVNGGGHAAGGGHHYTGAASAPSAHYGGGGGVGGGGHGGHKAAAPQIPILRNDYTNDGSGNYNFGFETGNGIRRDETGELKGGWPHGSLNVMGSYSYTGDDGKVYTVNYKADESGFHAEGDHLPTPPPIPKEIQDSLALHQRSSSSGRSYGGGPQNGGSSHYGGGGGGGRAGGNYYAGAASAPAPSTRYLPPGGAQQRHYARRH